MHHGLPRQALGQAPGVSSDVARTAGAAITGPIRLLVGFPVGGTIDIVARTIAEKMSADLQVTIVVEARAGAGGQLAAQQLRQAPPDGRTLMVGNDHTLIVVPLTVKAPGFEPTTDFTPIGQVARYVGAFAVASNIGVKDFSGFLAWAKANPAQANVGIPAPGSIPHFAMLGLGQQAGINLTTVPYKGSAPLVQDLAGGQIAGGTTAMGDFLDYHANGRMRIVAVVDGQRSSLLPDVPTFNELGFKLDWNYWLGLFGPAGLPASMVERLNASLSRALAQPDVRERFAKLVFEPAAGTPGALAETVASGVRFWQPQVKAAGWVLQ